MDIVKRKVTFQMYPNATQEAALMNLKIHHQQLYNWALKDRKQVYERFGVGLTYNDQSKINTGYRARRAGVLFNANAQSEQVTLKRVDLAFKGFFRRVKAGQAPGYPRFKSIDRFSGWGYASHGDGWKLFLEQRKDGRHQHGCVRLSDVGMVRVRGQSRNPGGIPKTAEVMHKQGKWLLSVTFSYAPGEITRESGDKAKALDWGVETYISLVDHEGNQEVVENPRFLKKARKRITVLQKDLALAPKGSSARRRIRRELGNAHTKVANKRKDYTHKESARIIKDSVLVAGEKLSPKSMTKSAKGTKENPGKNVKQKAGLNREIHNVSPAALYSALKYKAEEAGISFEEAPTRKLKPSQRCPECWKVVKKTLATRHHQCDCGCSMPRDMASATVVLKWALGIEPHTEQAGRGPALETPR